MATASVGLTIPIGVAGDHLRLGDFPAPAADSRLMMPNIPLQASVIWQEQIRRIGPERILRHMEGRNLNPLSDSSVFQGVVQDALLQAGFHFNKYRMFPLFDEERDAFMTFRPDFELRGVKIDGRSVLLDPHSVLYVNRQKLRKFKVFRKFYGDLYHVIIAVDTFPSAFANKLEWAGDRNGVIGDEIWYMMDEPRQSGDKRVNTTINPRGHRKEILAVLTDKLKTLQRRSEEYAHAETRESVPMLA